MGAYLWFMLVYMFSQDTGTHQQAQLIVLRVTLPLEAAFSCYNGRPCRVLSTPYLPLLLHRPSPSVTAVLRLSLLYTLPEA